MAVTNRFTLKLVHISKPCANPLVDFMFKSSPVNILLQKGDKLKRRNYEKLWFKIPALKLHRNGSSSSVKGYCPPTLYSIHSNISITTSSVTPFLWLVPALGPFLLLDTHHQGCLIAERATVSCKSLDVSTDKMGWNIIYLGWLQRGKTKQKIFDLHMPC